MNLFLREPSLEDKKEVLEIKNSSFIDLYPENLQNSKLIPYISEHLSFKISDFSKIYKKQKNESFNLLNNFNFLNSLREIVYRPIFGRYNQY